MQIPYTIYNLMTLGRLIYNDSSHSCGYLTPVLHKVHPALGLKARLA